MMCWLPSYLCPHIGGQPHSVGSAGTCVSQQHSFTHRLHALARAINEKNHSRENVHVCFWRHCQTETPWAPYGCEWRWGGEGEGKASGLKSRSNKTPQNNPQASAAPTTCDYLEVAQHLYAKTHHDDDCQHVQRYKRHLSTQCLHVQTEILPPHGVGRPQVG